MIERLKALFSRREREVHFKQQLERLRQQLPAPVFWLFGKTQSGKTSVIKFLTGADDAEIGRGFRPCTRFSRQYHFPTAEAPLITFLDTRGLGEPDYHPLVDLATFNSAAHAVMVTVKALDHAQETVLKHLRTIRRDEPRRPVVLVLTCLHEAYPQEQHPDHYPYDSFVADADSLEMDSSTVPDGLRRSLLEQRRRFGGLVDRIVPVDFTRPEEGFAKPDFGGEQLKRTLLEALPAGYRQTLLTLDAGLHELSDVYAGRAVPHIAAYSLLAASAGAFPVPWVDLILIGGIQTRMVYHLAELYGQPFTGVRFLELAGTLGWGIMVRQAAREIVKVIPFAGSVAGGALAGASTFALGKAFCYYYRAVHQGHVPNADELRHYYQEQLSRVEKEWTSVPAKGEPIGFTPAPPAAIAASFPADNW